MLRKAALPVFVFAKAGHLQRICRLDSVFIEAMHLNCELVDWKHASWCRLLIALSLFLWAWPDDDWQVINCHLANMSQVQTEYGTEKWKAWNRSNGQILSVCSFAQAPLWVWMIFPKHTDLPGSWRLISVWHRSATLQCSDHRLVHQGRLTW